MNTILNQFKDNIQRIRNLHSIYTHLSSDISSIIDISDVLRAELAFAVSAFDHYIHGIVRIGMLEIFSGKRIETPSFKKFNVSLERIRDAISNPSTFDWLEYEIIDQHSRNLFRNRIIYMKQ